MACVPFLALHANAQTLDAAAFDLGEIVVTPNVASLPEDRTGATVTVLDRSAIESAGTTGIADVLTRLPGVTASATGGLGAVETLRIRGLGGPYITVLVDGIDVSDPSSTQTSFDFGSLATPGIARVEVLEGTQSAQYGSEAVAGVVSLTTPRATEDGIHQSLATEAGAYGSRSAVYGFAAKSGRGDLAFTLAGIGTGGFSAADENDGNAEADGFASRRFSFAGSVHATDRLTFGASGFFQASEAGIDECCVRDGVTPADDIAHEISRGLRAYATLEGDVLTQTLSVYTFDRDRETRGTEDGFGSPPAPYAYLYNGHRTALAYKGTARVSDRLTLGFGADRTRETFFGATQGQFGDTADSGAHTITGVYGEAQVAVTPDLDLTATLRHDDHSQFGGHVSGRVAAAYRPQDGLVLRFSAGTGFRAPSLYELFSTDYGNPGLDPETSRSADLGVEKRFAGGATLRATLFYQEIDDLIQFVTLSEFPDPFIGQYQQVPGTTRSRGIELAGRLPLGGRVDLTGGLAYTNARDATGARLVRVPRATASIGVDARLTDRLWLRADALHVASLIDAGFPDPVPLQDYTLVNASLGLALTDRAEAYVRIENLLDQEYQTVSGYGTSDRAVFAGLRARF